MQDSRGDGYGFNLPDQSFDPLCIPEDVRKVRQFLHAIDSRNSCNASHCMGSCFQSRSVRGHSEKRWDCGNAGGQWTAATATDQAETNLTIAAPAALAADPAETNLTAADPVATATVPAGTDSTEEEPAAIKNEGKKMRLWGILELTAAALIFVFSVYLFLNTRGTKLLFVSVTFGRICRYYWIGLLAAIILGLVGWITLRWHSRTVRNRE